jgi:hypothetical protein
VSDFPTACSTLSQAGWLRLHVWCKACYHQAPADLQAHPRGSSMLRRAGLSPSAAGLVISPTDETMEWLLRAQGPERPQPPRCLAADPGQNLI